jgi:hypothetical protein
MAMSERPAGRVLRVSGLPGDPDQVYAGGPRFVAYCLGGEVRAQQRRLAIMRAEVAHRRAATGQGNSYPTALILCQRVGVALEDVARLVLGFESLPSGDPFDVLREARYGALDGAFARLAEDPEAFRAAVRLPTPEDTSELEPALREAILEASDALARRWIGHWTRSAAGWGLLRRLAKALRHGSPLLTRELVLGPPGAGALGQGLNDIYELWVLLVGTEVDHEAKELNTTYAMADVSEDTLSRARHAGLEAVALTRELAGTHVERVRSESKWALPRDVLKLIGPEHRRVLKEHARG